MITKPTKYTERFVLREVRSILTEIKNKPEIFFLGQIFEEKVYSMQRFSEWREKFTDNEEISETIKKIKELLETRVVVGAMKRELHPTLSIFHLKNNYKWIDKQDSEDTDKLQIYHFTSNLAPSLLSEMSDKKLLWIAK